MKRAWLVILALLTLSGSAAAQQTRQSLLLYNNTNITANGRGLITGPIVNNMNGQMINGMALQGDANNFTGLNTFNGSTAFNGAVTFQGGAAFSTFGGALFAATAYGNCIWDGSPNHDVGPCEQAAINAAAAAGGGTVVDPAGQFYFSEPLSITTPGVSVWGQGWGNPRDNIVNNKFLAITRFIYNGAPLTTTPALYIGPIAGASEWRTYNNNLVDIVFDGGGLANIVVETNNLSQSWLRFGCAEPAISGLACFWMTSQGGYGSVGSQENDVWVYSRTIGSNNNSAATGILVDGQGQFTGESTTLTSGVNSSQTTIPVASNAGFPQSSADINANYVILIDSEYMIVTGGWGTDTWTVTRGANASAAASHSNSASVSWTTPNVSLNRFHFIKAAASAGDGVVFGYSDNNHLDFVESYRYGANTAGSPLVWANQLYASPNGVRVHETMGDSHVEVLETAGVVQGLTSGSKWTVVQSNGTAHLNTVTTTVNGAVQGSGNGGSTNIVFASVTGMEPNTGLSCGGVSSGLYPNMVIRTVNGGTNTVNIASPGVVSSPGVAGIPNGQSCTVSYMVSATAVPGTYNIAWNGSSYNITAPAGGASQTNISPSGGVLAFTDVVIPWTGTPSSGDNWNLTIGNPAARVYAEFIDKGNSISDPYLEPGSANSCFKDPLQPNPVCGVFGVNMGQTTTFVGGGTWTPNTPTGYLSLAAGGTANNAQATLTTAVGGDFNSALGYESTNVGGHANTSTGFFGAGIGGSFGADRGRVNVAYQGGGSCNGQASCQTARGLLVGTGAGGATVRLAGDNSNTGGALTCWNIPDNTGYGMMVNIEIQKQGAAGAEFWPGWYMQLRRGAGVASTALDVGSTPTPLNSGVGGSVSAAADTTYGCVNLSVTFPSGGTWTATAGLSSLESQ